jgi:predicted phage-related endonuclease
VQHQLAVLGASWAAVAVLIGDEPVQYWDVERNEAFLEKYLPLTRDFWACVQRREPPAATSASLETLRRLYPTVEPTVVELPAEASAWHRQRVEGDTLEKKGKALREDATAKLLTALGAAEVGRLPGQDLSYVRTVVSREAYMVKASSYVKLSTRAARLPRREKGNGS